MKLNSIFRVFIEKAKLIFVIESWLSFQVVLLKIMLLVMEFKEF